MSRKENHYQTTPLNEGDVVKHRLTHREAVVQGKNKKGEITVKFSDSGAVQSFLREHLELVNLNPSLVDKVFENILRAVSATEGVTERSSKYGNLKSRLD